MDRSEREAMLARLDRDMHDLARYRMPFGRYGPGRLPPDGAPLYDLPLEYLLWFRAPDGGGGFPRGRLGELMAFVFEVKSVGADEVFAPLRRSAGGRHPLRPPPMWRERLRDVPEPD